MEVNDILKAIWSGTILGETWNCIGWYRADTLGDGMKESDVASSLFQGWDQTVNSVVCSTVTLYSVRIDNMTDEVGVGTFNGVSIGNDPGASMPAFVCYGIKQEVPTKLTRAGYKFVPGVAEAVCDGDEIEALQYDTFQAALTPLFGGPRQVYVAGGVVDGQISPVVVGREQVPPDSGKWFPELDRYQLVSGATLFPSLRSRVSRRQRT